ncbi:MAG TPA: GrpB family protein [Gammaproteobacteria bacterium]|nr:GrpB family protein [Gammaproteobacteria bacterium]
MILLTEYDNTWPLLFKQECERLTGIKSNHLILSIEHIGSTAIPNLSAKPIIDIMVGLKSIDLADESLVSEIQALGYIYKFEYEATIPDRRYFKRKSNLIGYNVHVVTYRSVFYNNLLLFKNILLSRPEVLKEYQELKYKLSLLYDNEFDYANAKTNFITAILQKFGKVKTHSLNKKLFW